MGIVGGAQESKTGFPLEGLGVSVELVGTEVAAKTNRPTRGLCHFRQHGAPAGKSVLGNRKRPNPNPYPTTLLSPIPQMVRKGCIRLQVTESV